ncbi:hypothetical protein GGI42DRAFT_145125 [Trichoderma sp. SZMC 28013]
MCISTAWRSDGWRPGFYSLFIPRPIYILSLLGGGHWGSSICCVFSSCFFSFSFLSLSYLKFLFVLFVCQFQISF